MEARARMGGENVGEIKENGMELRWMDVCSEDEAASTSIIHHRVV